MSKELYLELTQESFVLESIEALVDLFPVAWDGLRMDMTTLLILTTFLCNEISRAQTNIQHSIILCLYITYYHSLSSFIVNWNYFSLFRLYMNIDFPLKTILICSYLQTSAVHPSLQLIVKGMVWWPSWHIYWLFQLWYSNIQSLWRWTRVEEQINSLLSLTPALVSVGYCILGIRQSPPIQENTSNTLFDTPPLNTGEYQNLETYFPLTNLKATRPW